MFRPATLSRATAASRQILPQFTFTPTTFLARRTLTTETSTPEPTPTPQPETAVPQTPIETQTQTQTQQTTPATTTPAPATPSLPFHVGRTPSNNFAVYQLAKRGGNKKLTVIKKVQGDSTVLREMLAAGLGVTQQEVTPNKFTGHVVVAGHRRSEVTQWLEGQGF